MFEQPILTIFNSTTIPCRTTPEKSFSPFLLIAPEAFSMAQPVRLMGDGEEVETFVGN